MPDQDYCQKCDAELPLGEAYYHNDFGCLCFYCYQKFTQDEIQNHQKTMNKALDHLEQCMREIAEAQKKKED